MVRYKAQLVTQGFFKRPDIDYDETYSLKMDMITFRFLITLAVFERLEMYLMDVVTTYLYISLYSNIYMKIFDDIECLKYTLPQLILNKIAKIFV